MQHVDEFTEFPPMDKWSRYAAWFFMLHRLPAIMQANFGAWIEQYKLFCTYQGTRYRVTGASRLGDVWLTTNFDRNCGYNLRVNVDECREWSDAPQAQVPPEGSSPNNNLTGGS